ncbi:DNA-binding protein [Noviherbaspirillum sp. ST9]|uniref:DNA-binding protein n=1 Tax=Noviherbaspirillum sp. ST9 TaxID=3401606 RepID=UPI003B58B09B
MQTLHQYRQALNTAEAAKALNRAPQTLRKWACLENGPIRPIRINGRLAWPLDEIARLLNGGK